MKIKLEFFNKLKNADSWLKILCWILICFCSLQILLYAFGRDQSIYALIGDGILKAQVPYKDLWDFKPPGIFLIYALAQAIFGHKMMAIRILEVSSLLFTIMIMIGLAKSFTGEKGAGILGGAIMAVSAAQLEFWHTAQPETFGGYLIIVCLAIISYSGYLHKYWITWVLLGLIFGFLVLLKPTMIGNLLIFSIYIVLKKFIKRTNLKSFIIPLLVMGSFSLLPLILAILWLIEKGDQETLYWTFFTFVPGYTKISSSLLSPSDSFLLTLKIAFLQFSPIATFGFLTAIFLRPRSSKEREALILGINLILINMIGIAVQAKFFPYHFGCILPIFSFIAGIGCDKFWRLCKSKGILGVLSAIFLFILLILAPILRYDLDESFWFRSFKRLQHHLQLEKGHNYSFEGDLYKVSNFNLASNLEVADFIKNISAQGDRVFVWGFEPSIYWFSKRQPASRFIHNVSQRSQWAKLYSREILLSELEKYPPLIIIVQIGDRFPRVTGDYLDSREALFEFPELLNLLKSNYQLIRSIDNFEIYKKNDLP